MRDYRRAEYSYHNFNIDAEDRFPVRIREDTVQTQD